MKSPILVACIGLSLIAFGSSGATLKCTHDFTGGCALGCYPNDVIQIKCDTDDGYWPELGTDTDKVLCPDKWPFDSPPTGGEALCTTEELIAFKDWQTVAVTTGKDSPMGDHGLEFTMPSQVDVENVATLTCKSKDGTKLLPVTMWALPEGTSASAAAPGYLAFSVLASIFAVAFSTLW